MADEGEIASVLSETGCEPVWLTRATRPEAAALYDENRTRALAAGVFGRRATCSTAKFSGGRTVSTCSTTP